MSIKKWAIRGALFLGGCFIGYLSSRNGKEKSVTELQAEIENLRDLNRGLQRENTALAYHLGKSAGKREQIINF